MRNPTYFALCGVCIAAILLGINRMSKVRTAARGNGLSAAAMAFAIGLIFCLRAGDTDRRAIAAVCLALICGAMIGVFGAARAKMIAMPQIIALLNGLGGGASALVAAVTVMNRGTTVFESVTAGLALAIGALTLTGSLVAAGKLARVLSAKPVSLPRHGAVMAVLAALITAGILLETIASGAWSILVAVLSLAIGAAFAMRVGGADMPIAISLLNALSGVAGGIAGMAINEPLLVAAGGIVGASGLILTQDMCRAMNRRLPAILTGGTTTAAPPAADAESPSSDAKPPAADAESPAEDIPAQPEGLTEEAAAAALRAARKVIIVPGYGMALSQAQADVAKLADTFERRGAEVKFAIHPVAGRMPGHMSVLLCEADIDYDKLFMMEDINAEFAACDIALVVGANDVTNPAANTAEGTPIYGMPVLSVEDAPMAMFCNFDAKPGYAGVPNPLYEAGNVLLMLGDAKASVARLQSWLS